MPACNDNVVPNEGETRMRWSPHYRRCRKRKVELTPAHQASVPIIVIDMVVGSYSSGTWRVFHAPTTFSSPLALYRLGGPNSQALSPSQKDRRRWSTVPACAVSHVLTFNVRGWNEASAATQRKRACYGCTIYRGAPFTRKEASFFVGVFSVRWGARFPSKAGLVVYLRIRCRRWGRAFGPLCLATTSP